MRSNRISASSLEAPDYCKHFVSLLPSFNIVFIFLLNNDYKCISFCCKGADLPDPSSISFFLLSFSTSSSSPFLYFSRWEGNGVLIESTVRWRRKRRRRRRRRNRRQSHPLSLVIKLWLLEGDSSLLNSRLFIPLPARSPYQKDEMRGVERLAVIIPLFVSASLCIYTSVCGSFVRLPTRKRIRSYTRRYVMMMMMVLGSSGARQRWNILHVDER